MSTLHRSAKTGRFVKEATVKRHPGATVTERVSRSKKKKGGSRRGVS